ncbi:YIP1 family protein [Burkholderiaceae bacterium DAT-1]|nr:YIP1 family protein [Burkholderiaceae bacterium DAT-1]
MQNIIEIFTEPRAVFERIQDKGQGWLPWLLVSILGVASSWLYFSNVDSQWLAQELVRQASTSGASKVTVEQMQASITGMKYGGIIGAPISVALLFALSAIYLLLAGKLIGANQGFKQWFNFSAWASMPAVISSIAAIVAVVTMSPQTAMETLRVTTVDALVLHLPIDSPWRSFAGAADLMSIWSIALSTIGLQVWTRCSRMTAIVVCALPYVVIYGVWAAVIVAKH